MLGGLVVAVDGYSPTLIPPQLYVAVQATDHRGELGPEQEDVDAAKSRRLIQKVCHRLLQDALGEVGNQVAVHDDRRATLFGAESDAF